MLENLSSDRVCFIVIKAREFHAKEEAPVTPNTAWDPADAEGASDPPDERIPFIDILEATGDDPSYQQIDGYIKAMNDDERAELLALMLVGRGDYDISEWSSALQEARDYDTPDFTAYLMGHPMLADYLEEGLAAHGMSCDDVEMGHL